MKNAINEFKKNDSIVSTIVKIAVICISVAAALTAVLIIIKQWSKIKAAFSRLRDTLVYTCDDFGDDFYDDTCTDIECDDDVEEPAEEAPAAE